MNYANKLEIAGQQVSLQEPTYFIADIAANHDGDLERAKDLIWKAKEAGADCAKFQHFLSDKIVSAVGFSTMGQSVSHQAKWNRSVSEIYEAYHTRRDWTPTLVKTCQEAGIHFMTTPYDLEAIDEFADIVPAFKIGSGDITFSSAIERIALVGKPVLLATGASTMEEVIEAAELILKHNEHLCLMQCNTNYTGNMENFHHVNLNVLRSFSIQWPGMILGLSDHTPGHTAVLGAVAMGARVIEKHFTDNTQREGPDHSFALDPITWREMVNSTRELEFAIGDGVKRVEANERETVLIQRRAMRATENLPVGTVLQEKHFEALRPCPHGACSPSRLDLIIGRRLSNEKSFGEAIFWTDLD